MAHEMAQNPNADHEPRPGALQPLYEQAYAALAERIRTGDYRPGSRLPSERALGEALGMSRLPVRRALTQLMVAGVVSRRDGRGWFVGSNGDAPVSEPPGRLVSFTAMARGRGLTPSSVVIEQHVREATLDEATCFRIAPGAPLFEVERRRLLDGIAVAVEVNRVPLNRAPWIQEIDLGASSLYEAFDHHGLAPARADCVIEVVDATPEQARLLGVEVGKGLLAVSTVTFDLDGAPIEAGRICYRGDRYRFETQLLRG